jgi:hypothetical protein
MWNYIAPLRDMEFALRDVLDVEAAWADLPAFADFDLDTARLILETAGKFATEVLAPIKRNGDIQGCGWREGSVRTPHGYREAYRAFVEGGWASLTCDSEFGGQELPHVLGAAFNEMNRGCKSWLDHVSGLAYQEASPSSKQRHVAPRSMLATPTACAQQQRAQRLLFHCLARALGHSDARSAEPSQDARVPVCRRAGERNSS